jgi:indole-3-glycerol phosphate synthase
MLLDLVRAARQLGLAALVEAHDGHEVERALAAGAELIGVNARDLHTFEVDLGRCVELRARVPARLTYVAESGITSRADVARLRAARVDGMLVGTHLMRAADPGLALVDLLAPP